MGSRDRLCRARRIFWVLAVVAVVAAGSLNAALDAPPGAMTGFRVAVSGLTLIATSALATRVLVVLECAQRRAALGWGWRSRMGRRSWSKSPAHLRS